jgi:formylglycine-generating enzyme required for sulfatase activity
MGVSWDDTRQYLAWLSRKTGKTYRLLTEAEWEYVARAGTTTAFWWGNSITPQQANYDASVSYAGSPIGTKGGKTVEVGRYAPNAFGLYDVHGNVEEWVEDCWNVGYAGAPSEGSAWTSGDCAERVVRGGAWEMDPQYSRSANRISWDASLWNRDRGLRVARANDSGAISAPASTAATRAPRHVGPGRHSEQ